MKFSRNPLSRTSLFSRNFFRFDPTLPLTMFEGEGGGGGGATPPVVTKESVDAIVEAKVASVLASNKAGGDKDEAMKILARALHAQELRATTAAKDLEDAKKGVLSEQDKADLAALRELGIKPGEAKAEIESGRTAKGESAENKRLALLDKAAPALGYKPTALKRLSPKLEVVEEQIDVKDKDGKMTKESRYFFKDGETKTEISQHFADDKDALELLAAGDAESAATYVPYGKGPAIGNGKKTDVWDRIREEKKPKAEDKPAPSWQEQVGVRP